MPDDKKQRPKGRFVTTPESLRVAETVAGWMGRPFDPVENQKSVDNYHERMFQCILDTLKLPEETANFVSGSFRQTTTFAAKNLDTHHIVFDETFDFWTWGMTHYSCIATFEVLYDHDWDQLIDRLGAMLLMYNNAYMHETVREGFWYYMEKYKQHLEFSHTLSNAILGYVLCHEIAHCQLDHLGKPASKKVELEADLLAAKYFVQIISENQMSEQAPFYIQSAQYAAPLVATELLDLHEYWLHLNGIEPSEGNIHPTSWERKANIEGVIAPALNEESAHFYEGFKKATADIKYYMEQRING